MMVAHRHAERPGHVPCVPGDGRPAQGVMRPHAPQAVVRPNQALRRLPRQGPPLPDTAAAWAAPWRPREPGRSRDIDPQVELHRTPRLYLIGQERVHRGGQGGGGHRDPFSARVARVTAWRAPGRGILLPPWVTTAQEARPQPWRMSHGGVWQIWAECFTGSLVALPVLAASPPAVPLLPLTHRWWGGGRPPPALVTIGMPIAPSIRLPLGWTPDGVLSCHPYARRGERDGRAPTPHSRQDKL
jgi:hypothetical protein